MKTLYYNGTFLNFNHQVINNLLVEDSKIIGINVDIEKSYKLFDLRGKTLMPAFIDPHSHIIAFSKTFAICDLNYVKNFDEIIERLKKFKNDNNLGEKDLIVGFGYDHNDMIEKEHPNNKVLNKVSESNPILITHKSGHMGVINDAFLKLTPYKDDAFNGFYAENEFFKFMGYYKEPSKEVKAKNYLKAQEIYNSFGIAIYDEAKVLFDDFEFLKYLNTNHLIKGLINSHLVIDDIKNDEYLLYKDSLNGFRVVSSKIFLDGSPQGKTAYLLKPYEKSNEYGILNMNDEELYQLIKKSISLKLRVFAHCNGDGACEQYLRVLERLKKEGVDINSQRPVMIHAQLLQKDQLKRVKDLNMVTSFFVDHTYYYGDVHLINLGDRAYNISPMDSALKEGIVITLHQDTPVMLPHMFESIYHSMTRTTKNGIILNKNECLGIEDALKSVTINAAYQMGIEDKVGDLKVGMLANFIIIDENPYLIAKERIKDIKVLKTIINNEIVYEKKA